MKFISLNKSQRDEISYWSFYFKKRYGFKFLGSSYDRVPCVSKLFEEKKQIKEDFFQLEQYLLYSQFIDMKTNDFEEIRNIERSMNWEEYLWHKANNKLSSNCFGRESGIHISVISLMLVGNNSLELNIDYDKDYNSKTFNQKIDYVKTIDFKIYSFLEKIYKTYS